MNNVIINRGQGGLGRQPLGQDYISGFVFYGSAPQGFTTTNVLKFGGISDAVAAGIDGTSGDETQAQINFTVTSTGSTGDTVTITFNEPGSNIVTLATYTQVPTDTDADHLATHIAAAITANTYQNGGYTATAATDVVTVTVRPGLGIYPNSGSPLGITHTGTIAISARTLHLPGIASQWDIWYYHISRYFAQSPNAALYVGVWLPPTSFVGYAFTEVSSLQNFANGAIRQCGVYIPSTFLHAQVTAIQTQVNSQIANNCPLSVLIGSNFKGEFVSTLTDISGLNSEHVSVVLGQDGGAKGAALFVVSGQSVTQLGEVLGLVSRSQVSDDIAWVATYTLSPDGIENAVPAFATGELLSNISGGTIDSLDSYRFVFGRQFVNDSPNGTFVNDSHCATLYTSDYAYIQNNRTFDKANRQLYAAYIEQLAAPLTVNPDGTLTNSTVAFFEGLGEQALGNMAQANPNTGRPELSGFKVFINPAQNVLQTSSLVVTVKLQPVGVAREIIINLQFTVTL